MNSRWGEAPGDAEQLREASTHWSIIRQAQHGSPEEAQAALHQLVLRYSSPLLRYLQGPPWRFDVHAAHDLVQSFVQSRLLGGTFLARSDPARGNFRGYLRTAIDNFVRDRLRSPSQSPRPQAPGQSDDAPPPETFVKAGATVDPFDVAWARELLSSIIAHMQRYCDAQGQTAVWRVFEARLLSPVFEHSEPLSYERLAEELGFESPKAAANALITAKRIFRRLFDQAVGAYAADEDELQCEQQLIRSVFASGVTLAESSGSVTPMEDSALLARMFDLPHNRPVWSPLELEAALDQQLSSRLTDIASVENESQAVFRSVLEAFSTAEPALSELIAVKNWAKRECAVDAPAVPREVAGALYFAAIAAARARHHSRITDLTDPVLAASLSELRKQSWIAQPLQAHYAQCLRLLTPTAVR